MNPSRLRERAVPKQKRSRETVDRILDQTENVMLELGYEAINTNLIAERSGIKIGTLYHYFPNKFSILTAVIRRRLKELEAGWQEIGQADPDHEQIDEYFSNVLDMMEDFWGRRRAAMLLWSTLRWAPEIKSVSQSFVAVVAERNAETFGLYHPQLSLAQRKMMGLALEETGTAMLNKLLSLKGERKKHFRREMRSMILAYVLSPQSGN